MAVLIDPPLWPAHGTLFSHLVSDVSLDELHDLVRRTTISPRAFDQDHYDVPAHLIDEAVSAGAVRVTAHELTRRLTVSGLRIPAKERPARIRPRLLRAWGDLLPCAPELGERLLDQWDSPGREYHTSVHLAEVLENIRVLAEDEELDPESLRILRIAAWYHDAVYDGRPGEDERASAELCSRQLRPHLDPEDLERIRTIILGTIDHAEGPGEPGWPVFHDADLGILAAPSARYDRYAASVRTEYATVPEDLFRRTRAGILEGFLARSTVYLTGAARQRWEERARDNVQREISMLRTTSRA